MQSVDNNEIASDCTVNLELRTRPLAGVELLAFLLVIASSLIINPEEQFIQKDNYHKYNPAACLYSTENPSPHSRIPSPSLTIL